MFKRLKKKLSGKQAGPILKYNAYNDQVHMFTDLKNQRVIAVFPQSEQHVSEMPYLYKKERITPDLVTEWCDSHGIPYQIIGRHWSRMINERIKQRGMKPAE